MKYSKRRKKGTVIKKLANGGNGDPVKETTASPNMRVNPYGELYEYNEKEPAGGDPNYGYDRQLSKAERTSMDMYGFPGGGSNAQMAGMLDDPIFMTLLGGQAYKSLAALGEAAYSKLSGPISTIFQTSLTNPATGSAVAGGSITGEALINSYFASHGATNLPGDIVDFVNDPSWENAGHIGFDIFETVPVALDYFVPNAKLAIETASKSKPAQTPIISLESSTSGGAEASLTAVKNIEMRKAYSSYLSKQIESIKSEGVSGILTKDQVQKSIAETLAYNNEMMQQPKFFEKLLESIKSAELSSGEMIPGTGIKSAAAQQEWLRVANWRGADVTRFGYYDEASEGVVFFSTPEQTAKAMIDAMKGGDEVLRNAISRSREYMGRKMGLYKSSEGLTEFGQQFDGATIDFLNTLNEEQLLRVLAHEHKHAIDVPFLKHTLDEYHIGRFTRIDEVIPPQYVGPAGDLKYGRIKDGTLRSGSDLDKWTTGIGERGANPTATAEAIKSSYDVDLAYLLEPEEILARLTEIKIGWWKSQQKVGGQKMSEWMYNWTPEKTKKAFQMWEEGDSSNDLFFSVLKGNNEKERMENLTGLLNSVLTPSVPLLLGSAVSTQAKISDEETPTTNRRGGFISKKKKRKGYRSI